MTPEVSDNCGSGLALPKRATELHRRNSVQYVLQLLEHPSTLSAGQINLEAMSEVKGLFNRVARQDQWDWFTVSRQLGYPSTRISKVIAMYLGNLRVALRDGNEDLSTETRTNLCRLPTRKCLKVFLGSAKLANEENAGWMYILSTKTPALLKIGVTKNTVEEKVKQINAGKGDTIPFGVRCCWRVRDPGRAEAIVHTALEHYQIRGERAFFRMQFAEAKKSIANELTRHSLEIRTLDKLSVLAES
jgi:hypothetical protein